MTIGGTPSIYAGDELGYQGVKEERFGGDDAVRPEFGTPPAATRFPRRRSMGAAPIPDRVAPPAPVAAHASTSALRLDNRQYVYRPPRDDALIVALNIDDAPLRVWLKSGPAEVIAGSGAPPHEVVDSVTVEPHGWRILQPVYISR